MKTALITGGTSGIGLACALKLQSKGYKVIATGISLADIEKAEFPKGIHGVVLDVTSKESISEVMAGVTRLDALINCAGVIFRKGQEYEMENFEKVIDVNLNGSMRMCMAAKPFLMKSKGAIVNIASIRSFFGGPLNPAYTASKGGIMQLTKSLGVAWATDGVRVNAIAPGWIETSLTQALRDDAASEAVILGRTPMKRWGTGEEIADAAAFLLSDESRFMTGTTMIIDGGYSAG